MQFLYLLVGWPRWSQTELQYPRWISPIQSRSDLWNDHKCINRVWLIDISFYSGSPQRIINCTPLKIARVHTRMQYAYSWGGGEGGLYIALKQLWFFIEIFSLLFSVKAAKHKAPHSCHEHARYKFFCYCSVKLLAHMPTFNQFYAGQLCVW